MRTQRYRGSQKSPELTLLVRHIAGIVTDSPASLLAHAAESYPPRLTDHEWRAAGAQQKEGRRNKKRRRGGVGGTRPRMHQPHLPRFFAPVHSRLLLGVTFRWHSRPRASVRNVWAEGNVSWEEGSSDDFFRGDIEEGAQHGRDFGSQPRVGSRGIMMGFGLRCWFLRLFRSSEVWFPGCRGGPVQNAFQKFHDVTKQ